MGRRRSAWIALAIVLVGGCTFTPMPAESTAAACVNAEDDDHDGYQNCEDPDCWSFAVCRQRPDSGLPPLGQPMPPVDIPVDDDPLGPPTHEPILDGSVPVDEPMNQDSSTPDAPDASTDAGPPLTCGEYCPEGHCRPDGTCDVPLTYGAFEVTSLELSTPRTPPDSPDQPCYDYGNILDCPPLGCCAPDPFIIVSVSGTKAGLTETFEKTISATYSTAIELFLREGDEVGFEVIDADGEGGNETMFLCFTPVTTAAIASGKLRCQLAEDGPLGTKYFVAATLRREKDGGGDEGAEGDMP